MGIETLFTVRIFPKIDTFEIIVHVRPVRRGVSKGVEDGCKADLGVACPQGIVGQGGPG
jgi:hypothetical protein